MREFSISPFILFPAGLDACFVCADPLLPTSVIGRQGNLLLSIHLPGVLDQQRIAVPTGCEAINLTTEAGLSAIDASGVQKDRAAHLVVRFVLITLFQHRDRDQRPHPPIPS